MRFKILIFGVIIFCLISIYNLPATVACTIFYVKGQTGNYFASNEDWIFKDPAVQVVPGNKSDYGYLVFGWETYLPGYPQGGVNEHGVCLDWAALTPQYFKEYPKRKRLDEDLMDTILKKCKSTDEAISLIKRYNCSQLAGEHLLIGDRNGNSCIVEWSGKDYVFLRPDKDYQVITNFSISNPKIGWYPCQRFKTADDYLTQLVGPGKSKGNVLSFEAVKELLFKTHQKEGHPTIYSYIVAEKNLDVFIFYNHDYSKWIKINVLQELKKGARQFKIYQ